MDILSMLKGGMMKLQTIRRRPCHNRATMVEFSDRNMEDFATGDSLHRHM